jgi:hypothetical protein
MKLSNVTEVSGESEIYRASWKAGDWGRAVALQSYIQKPAVDRILFSGRTPVLVLFSFD